MATRHIACKFAERRWYHGSISKTACSQPFLQAVMPLKSTAITTTMIPQTKARRKVRIFNLSLAAETILTSWKQNWSTYSFTFPCVDVFLWILNAYPGMYKIITEHWQSKSGSIQAVCFQLSSCHCDERECQLIVSQTSLFFKLNAVHCVKWSRDLRMTLEHNDNPSCSETWLICKTRYKRANATQVNMHKLCYLRKDNYF